MMKVKYIKFFVLAAILSSLSGAAHARDQIRIVGSSTVYPFISVAAENFGRKGLFKTPIVEATGTGGGFKLFCSGVGRNTPDFINASRPIKKSEIALCNKNGINQIAEVKIGYDGIVLATSIESQDFKLELKHIFWALVRDVPDNGVLVPNRFKKWSEIDNKLPDVEIQVYGPPPTSGTRDSFVELVMHEACEEIKEYKQIIPDEKMLKNVCSTIREDGRFIEAGENDNLIIQKLKSNIGALGIVGYSFIEENTSVVKAASIDGVSPNAESISNEKYPVSRPLFTYAKLNHEGFIPGIKEFIEEITSERAVGDFGYFAERGLVPIHSDEKKSVVRKIESAD